MRRRSEPEIAKRPMGIARMVLASVLIATGVGVTVANLEVRDVPPAVHTSSDKGAVVPGVATGHVTVTTTARDPLSLTFVTEMHLTNDAKSPYVLEIRKPADMGVLECADACETNGPFEIAVEFSGSAIGSDYAIQISPSYRAELLEAGSIEMTRGDANRSSTVSAFVDDTPVGVEHVDAASDGGDRFVFGWSKLYNVSRPGDVGYSDWVMRVSVTPKEDVSVISGSHHVLRVPVVATTPSNATQVGSAVFHPLQGLKSAISTVDDIGSSVITGEVPVTGALGIRPDRFPEENSEVIAFIDQQTQRGIEATRQFWLFTGAVLAGAGIPLLIEWSVELLVRRRSRT